MFSEVGAKPLPGRAAPEWPPRLNVGDGRRWWASAAALSANFGRQVLCSFYAGTLPLAAVAGAGVGRSPEYR